MIPLSQDQALRAKALECALRVWLDADTQRAVLDRADLYEVYLRLGREAVEGMLEPKA